MRERVREGERYRDSERQRFREGESERVHDRYRARVWDRDRVRVREGRPRERVYTQRAVDDRNNFHRRGPRSNTGRSWWADEDYSPSRIAYVYQKDQSFDADNHGTWVEVTRKKKTKEVTNRDGPGRSSSHQQVGQKVTWRDKAGITTFYFSRFPEGMMEKDLWRIFQKWGKVWEVFIPRTKNKLGHRFGFVRFKGVMDEQRLERQLDNNIFIDGVKVFVNRPKFERGKVVNTREKGTSIRGEGDIPQVYKDGNGDKADQVENNIRDKPRSYATVVKEPVHGETEPMKSLVVMPGSDKTNYSPVILQSTKANSEWISKAWTARLKNRGMFERLEEELKWVVEDDSSPCYWADDWVIFPDMDESKAARLIDQEKDNGSTPISELQKWSPEIRPTHRLTWVLLWGLPLTVWEEELMAKVLAEVGEVVEVDEYVEARRRLDVARILVRTQKEPSLQANIPAIIDGIEYVLQVVEDTMSLGRSKKCPYHVSWLPPSPYSTQPNTPASGDVLHPRVFSGVDFPDGVSDDNLGADFDDRDTLLSPNPRRDHWVKTLARSCKDRSFIHDDAKPFQKDKVQIMQGIGAEVALTSSNGQLPRNGAALNEDVERDMQGIMLKAKHPVKDSFLDQAHLTYTIVDTQHRPEKGPTEDKEEALSLEANIPYEVQVTDKDKDTATQLPSELVAEELGQLIGPTSSVNKVYVRRKEMMKSKSKAHQLEDPFGVCNSEPHAEFLPPLQDKSDLITGSKDDFLTHISKDSFHMQSALLKEMGLSCGDQDSKV